MMEWILRLPVAAGTWPTCAPPTNSCSKYVYSYRAFRLSLTWWIADAMYHFPFLFFSRLAPRIDPFALVSYWRKHARRRVRRTCIQCLALLIYHSGNLISFSSYAVCSLKKIYTKSSLKRDAKRRFCFSITFSFLRNTVQDHTRNKKLVGAELVSFTLQLLYINCRGGVYISSIYISHY